MNILNVAEALAISCSLSSHKTDSANPTDLPILITFPSPINFPGEAGDKKIWSANEIAKLKPHEFVKYEKDIDLARLEGRIRN